MSQSQSARTWFAFVTVIAAWGSSYLFIRLAVESFTPFGLVAARFGAAGSCCAAVALLRREKWPGRAAMWRFALVGMLMMSGSNALTAYAQHSVASGVAGVVHALSSVWLAALGALGVWGPAVAKTAPKAWWGVGGGVLGVAILLWREPGRAQADFVGVMALVVATLVFACASVLQRRTQAVASVGLFAQLAVQMLAGSLMALTLGLATGVGFVHAPLTAVSFGALTYLTLISSIAGFAAYAVVLRNWPAARAGSFAVLNPLVSVGLGVAVLGEPVTSRLALGMVVTLASVAWVQRS